jgi:hypothetical protein
MSYSLSIISLLKLSVEILDDMSHAHIYKASAVSVNIDSRVYPTCWLRAPEDRRESVK